MAEKNYLLILRLEGALQSWGENAKWDARDSAAMPSKSGVVGLLGCALGLDRSDPELSALSDSIRMAVRADRPGVAFTDFHTVTAERLMAASGKPKSGGNTIITPRTYLQDACFTVFLHTDADLHERLVKALHAPRWCLYLGRKSCVPSRPVLICEQPEWDDLMEAVYKYPLAERAAKTVSFETEIPDDELASHLRTDVLLTGYREFAARRVWRGTLEVEQNVSDQS